MRKRFTAPNPFGAATVRERKQLLTKFYSRSIKEHY
jgi:hypothetical protein